MDHQRRSPFALIMLAALILANSPSGAARPWNLKATGLQPLADKSVRESGPSAGVDRTSDTVLQSGQWQLKTEQNGMAAEATGDASTPDGPTTASLSFHCIPGKGGGTTIDFIVSGAAKMEGFGFNDFEGPDAPAAPILLITLTAHKQSGDVMVKTGCSGFYGGQDVPDDSFTFEIASVVKGRGQKIKQLTDAIEAGATSISIRVQDYKNKQKFVEATFQTSGAASALSEVMKGCSQRH